MHTSNTCMYTHTYTQRQMHTHVLKHTPSLVSWAGGRWPSPARRVPWLFDQLSLSHCLPGSRSGEERREKAQNGHCQVEGSISLPAWGWGLGRERERKRDQSREACLEGKEERRSLAAGMIWHYTEGIALTVATICDAERHLFQGGRYNVNFGQSNIGFLFLNNKKAYFSFL